MTYYIAVCWLDTVAERLSESNNWVNCSSYNWESSVATDSEFASESANFSSVRPSPSPWIFGGWKWLFWNVGSKKFSPNFSNLYHQNPVSIGGKLLLITNRKPYMSFRLVPKSVTLNDLERRNGRYIASFHWIWLNMRSTHNRRVDLWRNARVYCILYVVRVRCRRTESSRSLSHLLMSFLFLQKTV